MIKNGLKTNSMEIPAMLNVKFMVLNDGAASGVKETSLEAFSSLAINKAARDQRGASASGNRGGASVNRGASVSGNRGATANRGARGTAVRRAFVPQQQRPAIPFGEIATGNPRGRLTLRLLFISNERHGRSANGPFIMFALRFQNPFNAEQSIRGFGYEARAPLLNSLKMGEVYDLENITIRNATANATGHAFEIQINYNTIFRAAVGNFLPARYDFYDIGNG